MCTRVVIWIDLCFALTCFLACGLSSCPLSLSPVLRPPQNVVVNADDLEQIAELGRGAYGVVDKMRHVPTGLIMAVKVSQRQTAAGTI